MTTNKTETLNVRLDSRLKQALKKAAELEHRTISNLIEHLIAQHCKQAGVSITTQPSNVLSPKTQ